MGGLNRACEEQCIVLEEVVCVRVCMCVRARVRVLCVRACVIGVVLLNAFHCSRNPHPTLTLASPSFGGCTFDLGVWNLSPPPGSWPF